tara:strand:+ start:175 stop:480 length:306 start_codon:yes stop_codon:yes gene_type:complete
MNKLQKLCLIIISASLIIFILLGYDSGEWLGVETHRFVPNYAVPIDTVVSDDPYERWIDQLVKDAENGEWVKDGYKIHWKTVVPFIVFLSSILGFILFKDK